MGPRTDACHDIHRVTSDAGRGQRRPGATTAARRPAGRRTAGRALVLGLLLGWLAALPAWGQEAARPTRTPVEAFVAPPLAGTLTVPAPRGRQVPAVVILHDMMGPDARGAAYAEQLDGAGIAVLDLLVAPVDGATIRHAVARLAADPRIDPWRIGALGFGAGALAAVEAAIGAGQDPFAARALLYPNCTALRLGFVRAPGATRLDGPVLLLHGALDPVNTPDDCADLVAEAAAVMPRLERIQYQGAGYAWDRPQYGLARQTLLPVPDDVGSRVRSTAWPELAELSAGRVALFFVQSLADQAAEHAARGAATRARAP